MATAPAVDNGLGFALAQNTQRLNTLEDLLRRSEGSLTHVLARLKEAELAVSQSQRITSKYQPEMQLVLEEITSIKRRTEAIDHMWRAKAQDIDTTVAAEMKNSRPQPLASDPLFTRNVSEVQVARQEIQDVSLNVKRLTETFSTESKALRNVEQDTRWLMDSMREQVASQRDFSASATRKQEQLLNAIQDEAMEREKQDVHVRSMVDGVVKALREEIASRFEAEAKSRLTLQSDIILAFAKMRDDVIKGFSQTALNLRNLDETSHSLETVLRAEVRSRMASLEDANHRVDEVEERVRKEASSAAEYLKAMDQQMSSALKDVRDVTAAETKSQVDGLRTSIADLQEKLKDENGGSRAQEGGAAPPANLELVLRRHQLAVDSEMTSMRTDILQSMEKRLTTAIPPKETLATKQDIRDTISILQLNIEEAKRDLARTALSSAEGVVTPQLFETRLAAVDSRITGSERNVKSVAESLLTAQKDLQEKVQLMERQAAAMETLQHGLAESWARDQQSMETYLHGIKDQVALMAEDQRTQTERLAAAGGVTTASGDVMATSSSGDGGAAIKLLEQDTASLRKAQKDFEMSMLKQLADVRAVGVEAKQIAMGSKETPARTIPVGTSPSSTAEDLRTLHERMDALEQKATRSTPPSQALGKTNSFTLAKEKTGGLPADNITMLQLTEDVESLKKGQRGLETKMMKEVSALRINTDALSSRLDDVSKTMSADVQHCKSNCSTIRNETEDFRAALVNDVFPSIKQSMEAYVQKAIKEATDRQSATTTNAHSGSFSATASGSTVAPLDAK